MTELWTVEVDTAVCVGSGLCAANAPECFSLDTSGRARQPEAPVVAADEVLEAAENCPATAITLRRTTGGEEIFVP